MNHYRPSPAALLVHEPDELSRLFDDRRSAIENWQVKEGNFETTVDCKDGVVSTKGIFMARFAL
jgi:hypothetical protein